MSLPDLRFTKSTSDEKNETEGLVPKWVDNMIKSPTHFSRIQVTKVDIPGQERSISPEEDSDEKKVGTDIQAIKYSVQNTT